MLLVPAGLLALAGCTAERARMQTPAAARPTAPTQGAAPGPNQAEAQAALQRRIEVCRSRYPASTSHFLDKARCDETARRAALLASGTPADLADAYLATRAAVAGRLDRGEITRERARHDLDAAAAETNTKAQARQRETTPIPAAAAGAVASALGPSDARPLSPPVPVHPGTPW